jgi:hypothetical protein
MPERYIAAQPYPWPYNGDLRPANTALFLNVAGKSYLVPKNTEKQRIPRSHDFRDPKVARLGRIHLPVAYPRSDLTSLRHPSLQRLRITGRLTPVYHTERLLQRQLDPSFAQR